MGGAVVGRAGHFVGLVGWWTGGLVDFVWNFESEFG